MKHNFTIIISLIALTISSYFFYENSYFAFILATIALVFILIVLLGSSLIQFNYFVKSINKGTGKGIALTFDDGPDAEMTPQILAILEKENIKATFFVIGSKIGGQEKILQKIFEEGHVVGNHSYSHNKKMTLFSTQKLIEDIANCSTTIESVTHKKPLFFRPPFGITNPRYNRAIKSFNMKSIGWSIRSFDTTANDKELLYKKVIKKITQGSIILFHDKKKITLDILPEVIQHCKDNGIKIVPLPELINERAYE